MPPRRSCVRWPGRKANGRTKAQLSLDIGRAISAGQELRPLVAKLGYGPKTISLDRLKIGQPDNVMLEGGGNFDRVNATGKLALNSSAASLGQITGLIAPLAPSFAARLNAMGTDPGPGAAKLALDLDKNAQQADRANARAVLDLDAPQLKGITTITAKPPSPRCAASISTRSGAAKSASNRNFIGAGPAHCWRCSASIASIAAGDGPAQFEGSATGAWRAPLRLKAKMSGSGPRCRCGGFGRAVGAGAQGQRQSEGSQRRSRAAARSQTVRHAGAEYRPVLACLARGQQADLRRSRQHDCGLAAARAPGADAWRRKEHRGRDRARPACAGAGLCAGDRRGRTRCRRAARRRADEGLARPASRFRRCAARSRAAANCSRSAAWSRATASR